MSLDVIGQYRYPSPVSDWLARQREDVIAPELAIIDPHHHLWEHDGQPYLLDQIGDDLASGHDVRATVLVEAHYAYRSTGPEALRSVGETEAVSVIAVHARAQKMRTDVCAGIVGFADLTHADGVDRVLDAHLAAAPARFRGVRHSVARDEHFPDGIVIRTPPIARD